MTGADLAALAGRVGPIVVFLLAITVTAEIAQLAGVFDVVGHAVARLGRHRVWLLWLLFAGFAVTCTVFLSLDTTAVLLTPVGLAIATQIGASPYPFALSTLWIANTGSLLLPVSNLTNLLAMHRLRLLGVGHPGYVRLALGPAVAAVAGTLLIIGLLYRRVLRATYAVDAPPEPHDPTLLRLAAGVTVAVGPLFAAGLSPAWVSSTAAAVLVAAAAWRAPAMLRLVSVPWLMALGFVAVSVFVAVAGPHGLTDLLSRLAGSGRTTAGLLRVAATGAVGANVADNLPAYLALEPAAASDPARLMALLVGVDAGPLVTPWGSLATLLWLQRCRSAGVVLPGGRLALAGLGCAVLAVGTATLVIPR